MTVSQLKAPFSAARSPLSWFFWVESFSGLLICRPVSHLSPYTWLTTKILLEHHLEVHAPGIRFARQEGRLPEDTLGVRI